MLTSTVIAGLVLKAKDAVWESDGIRRFLSLHVIFDSNENIPCNNFSLVLFIFVCVLFFFSVI